MTPWRECGWCHKVVKINKPIFGSMHVCLSDEEQAAIMMQRQQQTQIDPKVKDLFRRLGVPK